MPKRLTNPTARRAAAFVATATAAWLLAAPGVASAGPTVRVVRWVLTGGGGSVGHSNLASKARATVCKSAPVTAFSIRAQTRDIPGDPFLGGEIQLREVFGGPLGYFSRFVTLSGPSRQINLGVTPSSFPGHRQTKSLPAGTYTLKYALRDGGVVVAVHSLTLVENSAC